MARLPWNRKNKTVTKAQVPEEVEQYYESTRKERVGIAWLLALATLLLTLLIALGLFFAGRWAYRKFIANDDSSSTATTLEEGSEQVEQKPESNEDNADQGQSSGSDNGTTTPAPAPTSTPTPAPAQTPVTGPSASELPHTGPDVSD